ncbi:acyl-CoA dehydrogenase family protein [Actinomadura sp. NPDC047616]|uniref:acyl-CoA dehydrogenase family protein n=1 Tax=Actinomadura sp. NPDC047616 TaxID=3155914 RepID=UPI0033D202E8
MFVVDLTGGEVEMRAIPKMGRNAVSSYELFMDDFRVPRSALVGEEGSGFKYLLDGINPERILLAHESLGIGRAALRRAVRYAGERVVFNQPIGQNQGIACPLAEASMRLDAGPLPFHVGGEQRGPGTRRRGALRPGHRPSGRPRHLSRARLLTGASASAR